MLRLSYEFTRLRHSMRMPSSGRRIGVLTVRERAADSANPHSPVRWLCRCDCGAEIIRSASSLSKAVHERYAANCGCLTPVLVALGAEKRRGAASPLTGAFRANAVDETGKVYGELRVIGRARSRHGSAYWECACLRCGLVAEVRGKTLRSGRAVSCGCSRGDSEIRRAAARKRYGG